VIVALEVFLVITLRQRALAELETAAVVEAQSIAARIGHEFMLPKRRDQLQTELMPRFAPQVEGRIIVVDRSGILVADSEGDGLLGADYATPRRPELVSALAEQRPISVVRFSDRLGTEIMATAVPIIDESSFSGAVRITRSTAQVGANVWRIALGLVAIGLAPLIAGLVLAFGLANALARPLTRLAEAARRLGEGDLSVRAEKGQGAREIEALAHSFNDMADRLERTVRAQREFVANASHQLRTPLTGMKLRLEAAVGDARSDELRRQLEAADREIDRLSEIVDRLLVMARRVETGESTVVDLGKAARDALARWTERSQRLGSSLSSAGEGAAAQADPTDVAQILDNLIDNAITYAPGPIHVETGRDDSAAILAVEDRGPGIPEEERASVFERFSRGSSAPAGGSGLGLAIVRELAERWGAEVRLQEGSEGGTRIEVRFIASDI
jgi:signal transduction histidine kinase